MSEQTVQERNNPYLEGNFEPIIEEVTATDLQVEGDSTHQYSGD